MRFLKLSFYISNLILFIFYLYPGSIFGCFLYNDCNTQPQLTRDFIIFSSNHVYVFLIFSLLGILSFKKNLKKISYYLFSVSIFSSLMMDECISVKTMGVASAGAILTVCI